MPKPLIFLVYDLELTLFVFELVLQVCYFFLLFLHYATESFDLCVELSLFLFYLRGFMLDLLAGELLLKLLYYSVHFQEPPFIVFYGVGAFNGLN
jgi:hypothetical protein